MNLKSSPSTQYNSINAHSSKVLNTYKIYITFVIYPSLMMAKSLAESTWDITNYGKFIN